MIPLLALKAGAALCGGIAVSLVAGKLYSAAAARLRAFHATAREKSGALKGQKDEIRRRWLESCRALDRDHRSPQARKAKLAISAVAAIAALALTGGKVLLCLLAGACTFVFITVYFENKKKKEEQLFNDQLIESLGAIANSVKAGQSFPQAFAYAAENARPPLSIALNGALQQMQLGIPINDALTEMTQRWKGRDLRIIVNAIILARDTGGSMGEVLMRIAETMRERNRIQGKIEALTAQGKLSGSVMGGIPFLLLGVLYMMEPQMFSLLFTTLVGNVLLCVAVVMVVCGLLVIRKIVEIDI